MTSSVAGALVAIDTATRLSVVVVGFESAADTSVRAVQHRHGSHVLEQIDEVLADADTPLDGLSGIAVGTGPGSFTGLRVGLATAKTIAYARSLPINGIRSSDALRRAAVSAGAPDGVAVVMPAGAHDHYLARVGQDPVLVSPGGLHEALGDDPVLSVDMEPDQLGADAAGWGEAALEGLPAALFALARERSLQGPADDAAELVPVYVALPRGVSKTAEDLAWSPDLR